MNSNRDRSFRTAPPGDANVAKNTWWLAECLKHGQQAHLSYLGGACEKCQTERLDHSTVLSSST
jgi:hypothetical protein